MSLARLSVLDQSPVSAGSSGPEALANTLDLARAAERFGYHRFWVSEHHGGAMLAGPSPEALIPAIASITERIRVGSGGVMLPHYSPLKVAETFSLLAGLFPGRIDLALGRASGTDPMTAFALQRDRRQAAPDDFPQQLAELLAYLYKTLPADHPFKRLENALPGGDELPQPWLLGSSPQSAEWAAQLRLPYAFADFINPGGAEIARAYRDNFDRSTGAAPTTAVGVFALAADSQAEAERLAAPAGMALAQLRKGRPIPIPTPEEAQRYFQTQPMVAGRRAVVGTPERVRAELEQIADAYGAEEVIVVTITHDHAARVRSYELLASVCGLAPALGAAA